MDTRISQYEISDKLHESRLASRPRSHRRRNVTAFGVRPLLLMLVMVFCVCASARAQQAGPVGTIPVAGAAASNDKVSLTPEERQWLSQHDGRVRIGITVIPPQVLRSDGDGKYKGLAIDYIHLMERKLGCRFELVPYATWNELIQAAKMRQIDMIFAAQRTPERLAYLLFTEPYIELPNMILVRKDRQGGSSLKAMKGWSVAVSEGSAVHEYLKKEFGYLNLRPVQDELSGLMKVSMGEVDAMVVEISRASYYIGKAGILNLRVAGNAGLLYQLRFAVRNDWPVLCGILDKGLSSITEKERRDISQRWIIVGDRSIFASRAFWISLVAGLGVVTLTVVGVIVWNRTLQRIVRQRTAELQQELAERKKTEEALHRLNRELRAISNCNQVLVRAEDEQNLLNDICRIVCDEAGYRMAWVGFAESDEAKTVRSVAWAGVEDGYLANANITWADTERGRGPTGTAIRSGESVYIQDITAAPQAAPWRDSALQRGYHSSIALPLKDENENIFGVFNIYSTESNAFTQDEIRLLEELAGDLAFGITVLRARIERKQAEQNIALMNLALNNVHEAAFLIDENAHFHYVNEESCRILGYSRDELLGLGVADVAPDFPSERWQSHWDDLKMYGSLTFEGRHRARDGSILPVEISANYFEYDGRGYNLALVRDISERKQAEQERLTHLWLFESMDRVNRAIQGTNDLEQMMSAVLDAVLSIFDCDRAWLLYPLDPEAESWRVPMIRYRPEYPVTFPLGGEVPMLTESSLSFRIILDSGSPVAFGPGTEHPTPPEALNVFGVQSQIAMAIFPKTGKAWMFGLHQCSYARVWAQEEERLFQEIGRRLADGLTSLLAYRDLRESEEELRRLNEELDLRVRERTAELEEKNAQLERMNRLFVGRELRMVELKERIRELEERGA